MAEVKTFYNIQNLDLRELNFVLAQIADRIDKLEGLRGTPKFYSEVDMNTNKIANATLGTNSGEVLTAEVMPDSDLVGTTDTQTLSNKTLTSPTIADFTNAAHDHQDTDDGGQLDHGAALTAASLSDDDHTQYLLLAGRSGQEIIDTVYIGSVSSGDYIALTNTAIIIYADGEIIHRIGI